MKYYSVTAKCGHVGRAFYIPVSFPVQAESGKEAAARVRSFGRVKHHHKDAILGVQEICSEEYDVLLEQNRLDPYLCCRNVQEQRMIEGLASRICPEPADPVRGNRKSRKPVYAGKQAIRRPHVWASHTNFSDPEDWEDAVWSQA